MISYIPNLATTTAAMLKAFGHIRAPFFARQRKLWFFQYQFKKQFFAVIRGHFLALRRHRMVLGWAG
jgi:hypothetical protein